MIRQANTTLGKWGATLLLSLSAMSLQAQSTSSAPGSRAMNLAPMMPAKPALAYDLRIPPQETFVGNGAVQYAYIFALMPATDAALGEKLQKYGQLPLAELPEEEIQTFLAKYDRPLKALEKAARASRIDWELPWREEKFSLLLPHLSPIRQLTNLQALAIRLDIKAHRWTQANAKLRIGYAIARQMYQGDMLIEALVGMSIMNNFNKCLEEWVSQDGAPNLYWPMVNLPLTMDATLRASANEAYCMDYLNSPKFRGHAIQWKDFCRDFSQDFAGIEPTKEAAGKVGETFPPNLEVLFPQAREYLQKRGATTEELASLSPDEIAIRSCRLSFQEVAQESIKLVGLPYYQAQSIKAEATEIPVCLRHLMDFLPNFTGILRQEAKARRQLQMLQIIEVLRAHAAEHGKFPGSLGELKLPIPTLDPVSGQGYVYSSQGRSASLQGVPSQAGNDGQSYQLTLPK